MTTALVVSPEVRDIVVDAGGVPLSGLLTEPHGENPRATIVAVHGAGMRAGYFHGQAHPALSLLTLGASLGYTVLALDRPGYGMSGHRFPRGLRLVDQAACLWAALAGFGTTHRVGAGFFLVAHSFGGKLALRTAADGVGIIGLDISGCGWQYGPESVDPATAGRLDDWRLNWGPLSLYPPNTFRLSGGLVGPMPELERAEAMRWPDAFGDIAARVRVPVRLTFAEHEMWWRHDDEAVAAMTGKLAARCVRVDRQPDAGHNISLGWAARSYHLRALAFLEECLAHGDARLGTPLSRP